MGSVSGTSSPTLRLTPIRSSRPGQALDREQVAERIVSPGEPLEVTIDPRQTALDRVLPDCWRVAGGHRAA